MDESYSSCTSDSSNSYDDRAYTPTSISKCFLKGTFSDVDGTKILKDEEIYMRWTSICEVMNYILPISTKTMFHLLKLYKWNIEMIHDEIYKYTPDVFIERINIDIEEAFGQSNLIGINVEDECNICFSNEYLYKLNCNHACCLNCWRNYIASKVCLNYIKILNIFLDC